MIKVNVNTKNNTVNSIDISGHAEYDTKGKDIVCAAVSSITITTINAILKLDSNAIDYEQGNNLIIKVLKHDLVTDTLIQNMLDLLYELEKDYKKNIKINREVS